MKIGRNDSCHAYNDKRIIHLPRQVSWIGKQPFAKWGNIGHNRVEELSDSTDLTTKGARLDD